MLACVCLVFAQIGMLTYGGVVNSDLLRLYQIRFSVNIDLDNAY